MEHSLLHAVQLLGVVVALGGAVLVLALLNPASRALGPEPSRDALRLALADNVARWVFWGALAAGLGGLGDLLVQTAEVKGRTVFGGVELALAVRFATRTAVGRLLLLRVGALLLAAAAARSSGRQKWWAVAGCAVGAAVFASLVSHAAAQPSAHGAAVAAQLTHITAVAVWMGVLIHLLAVRPHLEAATPLPCLRLIADIIRRFSPIALLTAALLVVSGLYSLWRFLTTPGAVLTSAYGLTLVVKLLLLLPLLFAGFMNFRVIRPALLAAASSRRDSTSEAVAPGQVTRAVGSDRSAANLLRRLGGMLELEVTAGVMVITVAGILGSVAPPGEGGSARLTAAQVRALLSPDLPTTAITDLATMYDSPEHTVADLRYSEFTHNWSGVFVTLLGVCWLAQGLGGRLAAAGRVWPLLLLPFTVFVAVAADPEVWLLRRLSLWQVVSSPQLLEHQLGASLVLVLAWLGWRDQRTPPANRPLGSALPVVLIFGSLLLLGHAHSTLTITDELSNLINVQHAILGGFGLIAGTVRWLSLRGLFPPRTARYVWPGLIIALGLFMTFGYREEV